MDVGEAAGRQVLNVDHDLVIPGENEDNASVNEELPNNNREFGYWQGVNLYFLLIKFTIMNIFATAIPI